MTAAVHKTCNLCEAMCGLRIEPGETLRVRPDPDDVLSRGHVCPKAVALGEVQQDPDRVRRPLWREGESWSEISWEQAFERTAERIVDLQAHHGADSVASYLGNPAAHSFHAIMYLTLLTRALGTRNRYTASSVDQNPKHAACLLLFGSPFAIAVPDLDRTRHLLVLGANPVVSGGSLMTAPGFRRRVRALQARGGRLVVVDPRRSETAEIADAHHPIRPGRDALLLAAMLHTILDEGLERSSHVTPLCRGRAGLVDALRPLSPEAVAPDLEWPAERVRGLARELAAAPSAACYGRVGTTLHDYGTLNSWLIDVLNLATGNLDRPGGAMFPTPAVDLLGLLRVAGDRARIGEWKTRVRGAPAFNGEQPVACLAEEIATPGEGRVRGLVTIAGNPVLSTPNGRALERALAGLDFYAAVDLYVNETTRHANVILPPTWSLEHDNYEVLFHGFAVRNTAKYSPTVVAPDAGTRDEWEILSQLALRIGERSAGRDWQRRALRGVRRWDAIPRPRTVLDACLRIGPYGDRFVPGRSGLRLATLETHPHGVDLGPLSSRLPGLLDREQPWIDLAPEIIVSELARLAGERGRARTPSLQLIGRREMRTNNSWLHNTPACSGGRPRCTLQLHPDDVRERGLTPGGRARVRSRVGELEVTVECSDALLRGVASLPHGWGHDRPGARLSLASRDPGVSCNDLTDDTRLEGVVGNAVLNGVPIEVEPLPGV